jgi:hypothetical protein
VAEPELWGERLHSADRVWVLEQERRAVADAEHHGSSDREYRLIRSMAMYQSKSRGRAASTVYAQVAHNPLADRRDGGAAALGTTPTAGSSSPTPSSPPPRR